MSSEGGYIVAEMSPTASPDANRAALRAAYGYAGAEKRPLMIPPGDFPILGSGTAGALFCEPSNVPVVGLGASVTTLRFVQSTPEEFTGIYLPANASLSLRGVSLVSNIDAGGAADGTGARTAISIYCAGGNDLLLDDVASLWFGHGIWSDGNVRLTVSRSGIKARARAVLLTETANAAWAGALFERCEIGLSDNCYSGFQNALQITKNVGLQMRDCFITRSGDLGYGVYAVGGAAGSAARLLDNVSISSNVYNGVHLPGGAAVQYVGGTNSAKATGFIVGGDSYLDRVTFDGGDGTNGHGITDEKGFSGNLYGDRLIFKTRPNEASGMLNHILRTSTVASHVWEFSRSRFGNTTATGAIIRQEGGRAEFVDCDLSPTVCQDLTSIVAGVSKFTRCRNWSSKGPFFRAQLGDLDIEFNDCDFDLGHANFTATRHAAGTLTISGRNSTTHGGVVGVQGTGAMKVRNGSGVVSDVAQGTTEIPSLGSIRWP